MKTNDELFTYTDKTEEDMNQEIEVHLFKMIDNEVC